MTGRPKKKSGFRHLMLAIRRVLLLAVIAGTAVLLGIAAVDFPEPWVLWLSEKLSTELHKTDIDNVSFSLRRGLRFGRMRLRAAQTEEDPWLVLEQVNLRFRWLAGVPSPEWFKSMEVHRAVIKKLPDKSPEKSPSPATVFGPLPVRFDNLEFLGTPLRNVSAVLSSSGSRIEMEQLECDLSPPRYPEEAVQGEFTFEILEGSLKGALHGNFDPGRLTPLMRKLGLNGVPRIIERFEFPTEPLEVRMRIEYAPDLNIRHIEATLNAGSCFYRGVAFLSGRAALVAEGTDTWSLLRVDQLMVERPEGSAGGTITFDMDNDSVDFQASSTIDPRYCAQVLGIGREMHWEDWKIGSPAKISAEGKYAYEESSQKTAFTGRILVPRLQWRRLRINSADMEVEMNDHILKILRGKGEICGGNLNLEAELDLENRNEPAFDLSAQVNRAHFGTFAATLLAGRGLEDPGQLDLTLDLNGIFNENPLQHLRGKGASRVRKASLYRVPLFAGLTDFMARNVPGVDFVLSQNDINMEFTIENSGIHFSEFQVEGGVFGIRGEGDYWFSDNLDLGIRVSLFRQGTWLGRTFKVVLFPVSKLFELEVSGPVSNPEWSPTTLALRGRKTPHDPAASENNNLEDISVPAEETQ